MAEKVETTHDKATKSKFSTPTSTTRRVSRLRQPFKSPVLKTPKSEQSTKESAESEVEKLKKKIEEIDKQIEEMGFEYSEDELHAHIEKLHEYNEIKDVGQLLLGKIAEYEGKTTKMLYKEYGLEMKD